MTTITHEHIVFNSKIYHTVHVIITTTILAATEKKLLEKEPGSIFAIHKCFMNRV